MNLNNNFLNFLVQIQKYYYYLFWKLLFVDSFSNNVNQYRDFIHIDDVMESIILLIKKNFDKPINISSGKKINLIQ